MRMMTSLICVTKMKTLFEVIKTQHLLSQLYGQGESDMNVVRDSIIDGLMTMYQ
jgi:hypothetical protein